MSSVGCQGRGLTICQEDEVTVESRCVLHVGHRHPLVVSVDGVQVGFPRHGGVEAVYGPRQVGIVMRVRVRYQNP